MNALNFNVISLFLGTLLLSHGICKGQINESFAFPADDMTLTTDTINGIVYCNVAYYDTYNNGESAHPSLPAKYFTFSVPYNATDISVSANILDYNLIPSPAKVIPMQEPQPSNGSVSIEFTLPDSTIYNTNAYYPSQLAKIVDDGYLFGDNHVVTIAVCPIQYNPISNNLKVNNEIELNISYSLTNDSNLPMSVLSRNSEALRNDGINSTESFVYNPTSVSGFAAPFTPPITPLTTECLPMYQYCIITSHELAPAFERLVAFKKNKGYDAGIVCMEDIIACENYADGDIISGINDDAGKLRAFLSDAFKNGTEFVLLGGKEPHVPIRYGYDSIPEYKNYSKTLNWIPTDLYFSELNNNWNNNKNNKYGERAGDNVSYYPDIFVGRLLCKNIEEVNNYIDKLLIYELNPGNGDFSYLQHSFIIDADEMEEDGTANYIATECQSIFPYATIKHGSTDYSSGAEIISDLNFLPQSYLSFQGHGNPGCIKLCGKGGIGAIDNDHERDWFITKEYGNALDCLTNKNYPSICYSTACSTMPYDTLTIDSTTYSVSMNFGESFTLGKNYGGVAFLGNTRFGWLGIATSVRLEALFFKMLKNENLRLFPYKIGAVQAFSKTKQFSGNIATNVSHYIPLTHNLLGDPEFDIWTDIPVKYTDADIDIYRSDQGISVSGDCLEGAKIVVLNTNGDILNGIGKAVGSTTFSASPNSHVVIYRHNMIPYLAPLNIQNETINTPWHYFTSSVNIGSNADSNRASGAVIFDYNANCTIDASENVTLGPNLTIKSGATLTIRTKGNININGCTLKSGATLNLEGQNINIENNINAEANSNFNFTLIKD